MQPTMDRTQLATRFQTNSRIPRSAVFGPNDPVPLNLAEDARTMFAGAVGPDYRSGGVALLAINPGGGGDAYTRRTPADERLYPTLQRFRDAQDPALTLDTFEAVNTLFLPLLKTWNIWRIVQPCLEAAGVELPQAAYLNAVPYRTRGDQTPSVGAKQAAWRLATGPALDALQPGMIVALGKKAGDVLTRFYQGRARCFVVPRTIGDSYLSAAAMEVLVQVRAVRLA